MITPGARVGRYTVLAPIGAGASGEVYRARDEEAGNDLALKVITGDARDDDPRRARFVAEARAVAAIDERAMVRIYDIGEAVVEGRNVHFVAMELVSGESLREKLGVTDRVVVVEWIAKAAAALDRVHRVGIVHRDLKPDNILISREGEVKIADFAVAKLGDRRTGSTERDSDAPLIAEEIDAIAYRAPEQISGEARVDHRADIFSLGVILYEALAGRHPFAGATAAEVMRSIREDSPPPLDDHRLDAVARRCLSKDREKRYASARALAEALHAPDAIALRRTGPMRGVLIAAVIGVLWIIAAVVILFRIF